MDKEELKKEAEEWLSKNWVHYDFYDTECNTYNDDIKEDLIKAYLASREKQIEIDAEQIRDLQERNKKLLESCEGATMMYKDLQKATGIIKELLHALKNEDSDYTFALKSTHPVLVEAEKLIEERVTKNE